METPLFPWMGKPQLIGMGKPRFPWVGTPLFPTLGIEALPSAMRLDLVRAFAVASSSRANGQEYGKL